MKKRILFILLMFIAVIGLTGCGKNATELKQDEFYKAIESNVDEANKTYLNKTYKITGTINLVENSDIRIYGRGNLQFKIEFKNKEDFSNLKSGDTIEVVGKITEIIKVDNKPTTIVVKNSKFANK